MFNKFNTHNYAVLGRGLVAERIIPGLLRGFIHLPFALATKSKGRSPLHLDSAQVVHPSRASVLDEAPRTSSHRQFYGLGDV